MVSEEELKILEDKIEFWKKDPRIMIDEENFNFLKLLENLLQGYKELKEENEKQKKLTKIAQTISDESIKEALEEFEKDYIPKSKIKEKIEEYKKKADEFEEKKKDDFMGFWQREFLKACHKYQGLEELLKGDK